MAQSSGRIHLQGDSTLGPDQLPTAGPRAFPDGLARPSGPSTSPAEIGIIGLILVSGIATWVTGILTIGYDYDEVFRAHSTWLASQGLRPYSDFLDHHPPYFGILAAVLQAGSVEPSALLQRLRIFSAAGNALFLAALAVLGTASTGSGRLWGLLGVLLVAFHPAILVFLAEFRIDGWGYALMAWSIYRYRRPSLGAYRDLEFGLATTVASLWLCPKLALLPPMLVASERLVGWRSIRDAVFGGLAYLAGVLAATTLFGLYLTALGIGWDRAFDLLVRYHAISNGNAGTHFGLLRAILDRGILFWLILAAVIARAVHHLRGRTRPDPYEMAVAAWLATPAPPRQLPVQALFRAVVPPELLFRRPPRSGRLESLGSCPAGAPDRRMWLHRPRGRAGGARLVGCRRGAVG